MDSEVGLSPSENKGTLAGTRQLKRISEQKDTLSRPISSLVPPGVFVQRI